MSTEQSVVALWNEAMLEAIRAGGAKPTATTDQLFQTHAAIYDAWAAYDNHAYGLFGQFDRPDAEHTHANKAEAVSYAAYTALMDFFPGEKARFDALMAELGYDPDDTSSTAATLGVHAAQNVDAARGNDGSNRDGGYEAPFTYVPVNSPDPDAPNSETGPDFDPNHWQPLRVPTGAVVDENGIPIATDDPASYEDQVVLTPHWGSVTSFALEYPGEALPPPPPQYGDDSPYVDYFGYESTNHEAYVRQFTEVLDASANLTTEHKVIAEYWADGPRTESPPGHWNQIAQDIALREGHGIDDDAKMFLALNAAIFDAGIETWNSKNVHDFVRPQSAIRYLYQDEHVEAWGGPNEGTQTIPGLEWQPYQNLTFVTPPFQEYTSGHSAFSMAAATTIAHYVGDDTFYDGTSLSPYDLDSIPGRDLVGQYVTTELAFEDFEEDAPVVLQWDTLYDAAAEAGISRIYGGIHIQDGDHYGRDIGSHVAETAEVHWQALFSRAGDDRIVADKDGGVIYAGTGDDELRGKGGDDIMRPGLGHDEIWTRKGYDLIKGTAEELDGDTIHKLSLHDTIVVEHAEFGSYSVYYDPYAERLEIDVDYDGYADVTMHVSVKVENPYFMADYYGGHTDVYYVDGDTYFPYPNIVEGTPGKDNLEGTDGDDVFLPAGGKGDRIKSFDGYDDFIFYDTPGEHDRMVVRDFDVEKDALFIGDAEIRRVEDRSSGLWIQLEGDKDVILLKGVDDINDVLIYDSYYDVI